MLLAYAKICFKVASCNNEY